MTRSSYRCSRRHVMVGLAVGFGAMSAPFGVQALVGAQTLTRKTGSTPHKHCPGILDGLFSAPEEARAFGRRYLHANPHEREPTEALGAVLRGVGKTPPDAVRRHIRTAIQNDLTAGRVVLMDGFVMAETEARLCALVSSI